jgi:hypothetical protein
MTYCEIAGDSRVTLERSRVLNQKPRELES